MNLSSWHLAEELHVLNLGLSFVPTPLYNAFNIRIDFLKLMRSLKLKKKFGQTQSEPQNMWKKKSTLTPNIHDPWIAVFERFIYKDLEVAES